MKIISVLILVIAGCGFFGYYKHLQEKEASLIRMKKEIEEKKT